MINALTGAKEKYLMAYKIIKLTNGDNLICQIIDDVDNGEYKINFPLKMEIHSVLTKEGPVASLNLSRWIGPYTEQSKFLIKSDHVLLVANASPGLSRYYEHVLKEFNQSDTSTKKSNNSHKVVNNSQGFVMFSQVALDI